VIMYVVPAVTGVLVDQRNSRLAFRSIWLAALVVTLVACGGGSGQSGSGSSPLSAGPPAIPPPAAPPPAVPPPANTGSVVVRALTPAGTPVSGISVDLNGGFDGRTVTTDANGEAAFPGIPAGDASANLWGTGYHSARKRLTVTAGEQTRVTLSLLSVTEAVPVLLAMHPSQPSGDGRYLTFEADVAVLTSDGSSRQTLVANDFGLEGTCDWYACVVDADGRDTYAGYDTHVASAQLRAAPTSTNASAAVGVLVEQSEAMRWFDPDGLRLQATKEYFDRVLPPDLVALGSYRDLGLTSVLTTYGGFTSDGSRLRNALDGLAGQEGGESRTLAALVEMAGFMQSDLAVKTGAPRRALVVLTSDRAGSVDCPDSATCRRNELLAVEAAKAAGVAVIAAGPEYSPAAEVAALTGGANALINDPLQWPALFRALDSLVVGELPHYRVRFELDAGVPGVFVRGRTALGQLTIRVGSDTQLFAWYLAVPI